MAENSEDTITKAYEAVEIAKKTGKIKKGSNEATKAVETGAAKLVVVAKDTSPEEVVMHFAPLCKEKNVRLVEVPSKEDLGAAVGLRVSTSAVAIINEGNAKKIIDSLNKEEKEATEEESKETTEKPAEEKKEELKAEKSKETTEEKKE